MEHSERIQAATVKKQYGAYLILMNDTAPEFEDWTIHDNATAASSLTLAKRVAREQASSASGWSGPWNWKQDGPHWTLTGTYCDGIDYEDDGHY